MVHTTKSKSLIVTEPESGLKVELHENQEFLKLPAIQQAYTGTVGEFEVHVFLSRMGSVCESWYARVYDHLGRVTRGKFGIVTYGEVHWDDHHFEMHGDQVQDAARSALQFVALIQSIAASK